MSYYYAFDDGVVRGPVTADVLKTLRLGDALRDDSPVISHGEATWSTYREKLAQLASAVASPRLTAPPPLAATSQSGSTPLPPPLPAGAAQPVAPRAVAQQVKTAAPASAKTRISRAAAQVAAAASQEKGEFDAVAQIRFPVVSFRQSILSRDPAMPDSWQFFIRIFGQGELRIPQLYIVTSNSSAQGLVMFNRASVSGGYQLELTHINYERQSLSNTSWVVEHLTVGLPIPLLRAHFEQPLRVQVSRPDEGIRFIVEVPAYYIAGVLAKLDPDDYEVDSSEPESVAEAKVQGHVWKAVLAGVAFGLFSMYNYNVGFFFGLIAGAIFGGAMYRVVWHNRKKAAEKWS